MRSLGRHVLAEFYGCCAEVAVPGAAVKHLRRGLRADHVMVREIPRGVLAPAEGEGRREPLAASLPPSLPW